MRLRDLPKGEKVFVDANIFLSHIFEEKDTLEECARFLKRLHAGEFKGYTSIIVLNEVFHRTAIAEVGESKKARLSRAAVFLKEHPEVFQSLAKPWRAGITLSRSPPSAM